MMRLSKKFILGIGFILICSSLSAEIVKIGEDVKEVDSMEVKNCMINNSSTDVKKAMTEKFEFYFTSPYPAYFSKGFLLNGKIYLFDKNVINPINKNDYVFCNEIKSNHSIKLSKDVTNLIFEYYDLNNQLLNVDKHYSFNSYQNPFKIQNMDKESLIKLNNSIVKTITNLR